jgi:hypothetical protein
MVEEEISRPFEKVSVVVVAFEGNRYPKVV